MQLLQRFHCEWATENKYANEKNKDSNNYKILLVCLLTNEIAGLILTVVINLSLDPDLTFALTNVNPFHWVLQHFPFIVLNQHIPFQGKRLTAKVHSSLFCQLIFREAVVSCSERAKWTDGTRDQFFSIDFHSSSAKHPSQEWIHSNCSLASKHNWRAYYYHPKEANELKTYQMHSEFCPWCWWSSQATSKITYCCFIFTILNL